MKLKYIFNTIAVAAVTMFTACTDNDYTELDKGSEELAISASSMEVILNEAEHSSEAVKVTWTTTILQSQCTSIQVRRRNIHGHQTWNR